MQWRVLMELVGPDGGLRGHQISSGAIPTNGTPAAALGITPGNSAGKR